MPWLWLQLRNGCPGPCWECWWSCSQPTCSAGAVLLASLPERFHVFLSSPSKVPCFPGNANPVESFPGFLFPFHPRDGFDHLNNHKEQISDGERRISVSHRNHWHNGWNNSILSLSMDKSFIWHWCFGLPRKIPGMGVCEPNLTFPSLSFTKGILECLGWKGLEDHLIQPRQGYFHGTFPLPGEGLATR